MALENIRSFLLQQLDQSIVNVFINFCDKEQYDEISIEDDIEEAKDSYVYEHMQSKLQWNDLQTHTFIQAVQNYFNPSIIQNNNNDDDESSPSLTGIYSNADISTPPPVQLQNNNNNNVNLSVLSTELQSIANTLSTSYQPEIVKIFVDFCQEQEYQKTNIVEDIEEDDDSFIFDHMQTKCNWNIQQCQSFIHILYKTLTGNDKKSIPTAQILHKSQSTNINLQHKLQQIPKLQHSATVPNAHQHKKCMDPNCPFNKFKRNMARNASNPSNPNHNPYRNSIHQIFRIGGALQPLLDALLITHKLAAEYRRNMNSNTNIGSVGKPKQTNKPQTVYVAQKHDKHGKHSYSQLQSHSNAYKESSSDMKVAPDPSKDYTSIDVETRARISRRKMMKEKFKNGTFYQDTKYMKAAPKPIPFMSESVADFNFNFGDDDDWKTVSDDFAPFNNEANIKNYNYKNSNADNMVGLRNIGATCYMNAVLQAINCSDMYRDFLLNNVNELRYDPKWAKKYKMKNQAANEVQTQYSRQQQATIEFKNLLRTLYEKKQRVADTQSFVRKLPKRWRPGKQQDSNEFAKFVLNCIWETIDQSSIMEDIYDKTSFHWTEIHQLKQLRLDPFSHGMLNYTTKCMSCQSKSAKFEAFFDLALALTNYKKISTKQLIDDHMKAEHLSADNTYFCHKCNANVSAMRFISIVRPPKLLLICFKRYQVNLQTQTREKIMQSVDCPLLLQIERDIQDSSNHEIVPYILYAVVVHHGHNAQFGHYYSFGRHSDDAFKCYLNNKSQNIAYSHDIKEQQQNENIYNRLDGGNWYRFDDERVTRSSYKQLNSLPSNDTPYMLFYLRAKDE